MKKLNRKGFTLVELLAVIIVLAIVIGITIPSMNTIINKSKNSALKDVLDYAENYLNDQYAFMSVDYSTASENFTSFFNSSNTKTLSFNDESADKTKVVALLKEMGLNANNITSLDVTFTDGIACVTVNSIPTTSDYYVTTYWTNEGGSALPKDGSGVSSKSKSCQ